MQIKSKLMTCAATTALLTPLYFAPAFAQEAPAIEEIAQTTSSEPEDEIVVTGSRIARTNAQSAVPLQVLSGVDFEESGTNDISEALTDIPGISYGVSQRGSNNQIQTAGLTTISLRRLGDNRTLVLLNGKRAVSNSGNSDRVSTSTIPGGLLKRTEVTTGGASAIYGSDAIAGVVNFVLEDDFEGFETDVSYSTPEASGGEEFEFEATWGTKFGKDDRGYFLISGSYQDENEILADSSRPLTLLAVEFDDPVEPTSGDAFTEEHLRPGCDFTRADGTFDGDRYCLVPSYSSNTPGGVFEGDAWVTRDGVFVNDQEGAFIAGPLSRGSRDHFTDFDGFDFRPGRTIEGSREIANLAVRSAYDISTSATASVTAMFSRVDSVTKGGFETIGGGETYGLNNDIAVGNIASDHPFIPLVVEETRSGSVSFSRRLVELGEQSRINQRDTLRLLADVKGDLSNGFRYEVFGTYGKFTQEQANPNEVNYYNADRALDIESDGSGGFQCMDADARADGCVPLNLFGLNSITPEAADYIRYDAFSEQERTQTTFGGHLAGDLFDWKAGTIKFAAGAEYRRETQDTIGDLDDPINLGGQDGDLTTDDVNVSSFSSFPTNSASYDVVEGFAELDVPVLKDLFTVQLAGRLAEYSTVGTISSYNVGGVLTPFEGFKLRGQYSRSQRAPNLTDLFSPARTDSDTIAGPCNDLAEDGTGIQELEGTGGAEAGTSILATVTANCLATPGIQAYFADPDNRNTDGTIDAFDDDGSIRGPNAGNPNVDVETADTFTIGAVIQPSQIEGLTIIADYFRIEIADVISSISSQDQIDLCYAATDFPSNAFCSPITRDPLTGQVTEIVNQVQNLNEELVEGLDVAIEYEWEFGMIPGDFDIDLRYSHYFTEQTKFNGLNGELTQTFLGEIQNPDNEFRARVGYSLDNIRLSYRLSFEQGGVDDINNNPLPDDNQYFRVEDQFYHNIYARYEFGDDDQYRIYGGVNNIADNLGPLIPTGTSNGSSLNIVSDLARPVGREFYIGARVRF